MVPLADLYYGSMTAMFVTQYFFVWLTFVHCTLNPRDLKHACTVNLVSVNHSCKRLGWHLFQHNPQMVQELQHLQKRHQRQRKRRRLLKLASKRLRMLLEQLWRRLRARKRRRRRKRRQRDTCCHTLYCRCVSSCQRVSVLRGDCHCVLSNHLTLLIMNTCVMSSDINSN